MAYNHYNNSNNCSPYFQPPSGENSRGKYSDPSGNTGGYQDSSYQPLSAYQTSYQQTQSSAPQPASSSAYAYGDQGYGNVNGAATSRPQETTTSYKSVGRQTDTTALGNLAYASTLGRDNTSLPQNGSHNRTQDYPSTGSYGINSIVSASYGASHQRTDSRNSSSPPREEPGGRSQTAASTPSYVANQSDAVHNRPPGRTPSNWQAQAQYIAAQRPSADQSRVSQYSTQSPRPTSGQAIQRPSSRVNTQAVPLPKASTAHAPSQIDGGSAHSLSHNRVQSPRQHMNRTTETPAGFRAGNTKPKMQPQTTTGQFSTQQVPKVASINQTPQAVRQPVATDTRVNGDTSQSSTPTMSEYPTTVDPSQVFNHVEYQRRQAAAAAEQEAARNKAAEVAKAVQHSNSEPLKNKILQGSEMQHAPGPSAPISGDRDPDTAKKDQMELEMKQMIEKMRDYKSKDPSLFSQIWEQVKKGQPPQRAPSVPAGQGSASPIVNSGQLPGPTPANVQLPPESELPAAEGVFPPDFDRGRYPAQRRRRGNKEYTPPRKDKSHHKKVTPSAGTSTPVPNGYVAASSTLNPGKQTMQQAMEHFHKNLASPVPQASTQNAPPSIATKQATARVAVASSSTPTPAATGQMQPPKAGGTYWPENKKRALAEAARAALASQNANQGKQIDTDEIHELLNQNPSYTQMCEILEYRGFTIDRSQFARLLLKAVPDLGSSSAAPPSTSAPSTSSAPIAQAPPPPPPPPPQNQVSGLNRALGPFPSAFPPTDMQGYITPYALPGAPGRPQAQQNRLGVAPVAHYQGNGFVNPALRPMGPPFTDTASVPAPSRTINSSAETKSGLKWADQPGLKPASPKLNQPSNKEQMAKKRSFADIVDLTALSDDDLEPPNQRPRFEDATSVPTMGVPNNLPFDTDPAFNQVSDNMAYRSLQKHVETPMSIKDKPSLEDLKYKSQRELLQSKRTELLQSKDVARPLNKRQDALRRSSYNARTIGRDILISMGKHPTMQPLNAHLYNLRERFQNIDLDSDLSTIRWELIDPVAPSVPTYAPGVENNRHGADNESAGAATSRHRNRFSVVVGVGPTEGDENTNTLSPQTPLTSVEIRPKGGRPSRGGGVAGSATRSDGPGISGQQHMPPPPTSSDSNSQSSQNFDHFVHNYIPSMQTPFMGSNNGSSSLGGGTPATATPTLNTPISGDVPKKKHGRPPGAKNKHPRSDKGTLKRPRGPVTSSPGAGSTPNRTSGSSDTPMLSRPRIDTTPARPSSLRNAMSPGSSANFAVVIPSRSPSIASTPHAGSYEGSYTGSAQAAKRGRTKNDTVAINQPEYKVYKCQWESCPAELHNLKTLKKHIRKHRGQYGKGPYPCLWQNCFRLKADGSQTSENIVLKTDLEWDKHMERKHMNAVAWELGDGPATHSSDYDTETDLHSRQVTPIISLSKRRGQALASPASPSIPNLHSITSNSDNAQAGGTPLQRRFSIVI